MGRGIYIFLEYLLLKYVSWDFYYCVIFWIVKLLFLYNDVKLMKGKDLDFLIFVDLKKKRWKKKISKYGIFDFKIRCWLL